MQIESSERLRYLGKPGKIRKIGTPTIFLARLLVVAAQKGATDAATHTMEENGLLIADQLAAWVSPVPSLVRDCELANPECVRRAVGKLLGIVSVRIFRVS